MAINGCEICGTMTNLSVDHDHRTGNVRGVLCRPHNAAIGLIGENPKLLEKTIRYLEKHQCPL